MRKATTVKPIMWRKPSFRRLNPNTKLLFLLLTTGPEVNLGPIQAYTLEEMMAMTGLKAEEVRESIGYLVAKNRVLWDPEYGLVLLLRWIKHNPLTNEKLEAGAMNSIAAYEHHYFYEKAVSLINGADPDTLCDGVSDGVSYTPQIPLRDRDRDREKKEKSLKKENHPVKDSVCCQILDLVNDKFGLQRKQTKALFHAVDLCFKEGYAPDDVVKVARHRLTEGWWEPRKYGAESLIRLKSFESALERATEEPPKPKVVDHFEPDPEITEEDREKSLEYLQNLNGVGKWE